MDLRRVMIVDDDQFDQLAYKRILRKIDAAIEVIPFQYATEALEYLKIEEREEIDAILLDINMPRMTGFEFLESAQAELAERFAKEIVIMVTTSLDPLDQNRAKNFPQVRAFFSKPLTADNIETIDQMVSARRAG
jgi:CheY-like chemotaxis protein